MLDRLFTSNFLENGQSIMPEAADYAEPLTKFHDQRHTFGTLCASSGVPVSEIRVYMSHASLSTTEIYMHHAPKHDTTQRLTAAFGGVALPSERGVSLSL